MIYFADGAQITASLPSDKRLDGVASGTSGKQGIFLDGVRQPAGGGGGGGGSPSSYARLTYRVASGVTADGITAGARRTRTINTIDIDDDAIVTLASNKFTLEAGTYHLLIAEAMTNTNEYISWVYDVTGLSYSPPSSCCRSPNSVNSTNVHAYTVSPVVTTEYEIQAQAASGSQGASVSSGPDEIYMAVEIWKVA